MPQVMKRVDRATQDSKASLPALDWESSGGSKWGSAAAAEAVFGFDVEEQI
jgi:hypothetical protein